MAYELDTNPVTSSRELYKDGRQSKWGDLLPLPADKK